MRQYPPNDPQRFAAQSLAARERLGTRYLFHPANRVRKIWQGPRAATESMK